MNPADQRWWRDRENSGALACQRGPASPTGSPRLASDATAAVAAAAVEGAAATAASTVVAAGTVAGEVAGGGKVTVPAGHETLCGLRDPWPWLCHS